MRRAIAIALVCACTTDNPAFDDVDRADDGSIDDSATKASTDTAADDDSNLEETGADVCEPSDPERLVTFDPELPPCTDGRVLDVRGMVIEQVGSALSVVPCPDGCPCEPLDPPMGVVLHPTIVLPVFSDCIDLEVGLVGDECWPIALDLRRATDSNDLLVHAEYLGVVEPPLGLTVSAAVQDGCDCEPCPDDERSGGEYGLTFSSDLDTVGPLATDEIAEMMLHENGDPVKFTVAALSTTLPCECAARTGLQWSATRS